MAIYNRDRKQQQQVVTPNGKINKYILVTTTRLLLRNADDASFLGCESSHQLGLVGFGELDFGVSPYLVNSDKNCIAIITQNP